MAVAFLHRKPPIKMDATNIPSTSRLYSSKCYPLFIDRLRRMIKPLKYWSTVEATHASVYENPWQNDGLVQNQ